MEDEDLNRRVEAISEFFHNSRRDSVEAYEIIQHQFSGRGAIMPVSVYGEIFPEAFKKVAKLEEHNGKPFEGRELITAINRAVATVTNEKYPLHPGQRYPGDN